ncbi:hypothetical protein IL38_15915 [Actinopolyspora erythraea]|uniref:Uncharacterized protein n=1 Tax=Actinopolyspora erythraea TaxID=414996 RepID=A0ABR4X2I8_9ACTN|nr:hypothetical protein IL38_15915 [Actinopolyspora erythraea]
MACGVVELGDLVEYPQHGHGRFFGSALAQMVPKRLDQGGLVLRGPHQSFGLAGTSTTLDRVQRQVQSAGDFEQHDAVVEQIMHLAPAFPGRSGALVLSGRWAGLVPADAVDGGFFKEGFGKIVPQVLSAGDLHRVRPCAADSFGVGAGTVPADHPHAVMLV